MNLIEQVEKYTISNFLDSLLVVAATAFRFSDITTVSFNVILFQKRKNTVSVTKEASALDEIAINKWIEFNVPQTCAVMFNLNGDKIIHRKIADTNSVETLITEIVPNADKAQFYLQQFAVANAMLVVSLVRRSYLDDILNMLTLDRRKLINVSIGPFNVRHLHALPNIPELNITKIRFQNYELEMQEGKLSHFSILPYGSNIESYNITVGTEVVSSSMLVAFACGLSFFIDPKMYGQISLPWVDDNYKETAFSIASKRIIFTALGGLFILLIISSVIFTSYNQKLQEVNNQLSAKRGLISKYNSVLLRNKYQKEILKKSGLLTSSKLSRIADDLTSTLPDNLYLRKLELHPVNNKNISAKIDFVENKIVIYGNAYSNATLNEWIDALKPYKWIQSILIKEYKQASDATIGTFAIEITQNTTEI